MARVIEFMYTGNYVEDAICNLSQAQGSTMSSSEPSRFSSSKNAPFKHEVQSGNDLKKFVPGEDISLEERKNTAIANLGPNIKVYKCADMLGIDSLTQKAKHRIWEAATLTFDDKRFAVPLRMIYEATRLDDELLRFPVTQLLCRQYQKIKDVSELVEVIKQYERTAWTLFAEEKERAFASYHREIDQVLKTACSCGSATKAVRRSNEGHLQVFCQGRYCRGRDLPEFGVDAPCVEKNSRAHKHPRL
jgi:hypothetical protein